MMGSLPDRPRRILLRSFYGFNPEDDGYIGWTKESHRDRILSQIEDGDVFMIYGAVSPETKKSQRRRVLGFIQVEARAIRDIEKSSAAGLQQKRVNGWKDQWTHAIPVVRAWRADETILLERIAPTTYRSEAGQAIAVWSPELQPDEIDRAMKIKVTQVSVFGEPPAPEAAVREVPFEFAWRPSRAFPGSFGTRTSNYEDGPTQLYLARFDGDCHALLGERKVPFDKSVIVKIGVSNDTKRRLRELNSGFPPASIGKWSMQILSAPYEGREAAEDAERLFKRKADAQMRSLGGEFFCGDLTTAQIIFASIPGVSRFGK